MKPNPIPEYGGAWCSSDCRREGCEHGLDFDRANGIVRSGLDFDIKSDKKTTHYEVIIQKHD